MMKELVVFAVGVGAGSVLTLAFMRWVLSRWSA